MCQRYIHECMEIHAVASPQQIVHFPWKNHSQFILEELHDCIPATGDAEQIIDDLALAEVFNCFLASLPKERRKIFMRRYWYLSPIKEISTDYSISESKVKMSLLRSRNELKQILEKEGVSL